MRECKLLTVLLYLSVLFFCCDCEDPCHVLLSVDITNGSKLLDGTIKHNGTRYSSKQYFTFTDEVNEIHTRGCICLVKTCMRKCCPLGYGLEENRCVESEEDLVKEFNPQIHLLDSETSGLTVTNHFGIIRNSLCPEKTVKITLNPDEKHAEDEFYLQEDGRLYLPKLGLDDMFLGPKDYCLDAFLSRPSDALPPGGSPTTELDANWTTKYLVYICMENSPPEPDAEVFVSLSIGLTISIPFLMATFLVYAFIPELRNLHGKTIMNYIAGLILAFISLLIIQNRNTYNKDNTACVLMAFSTFFFFMVSFFWLNIMCIDVWWTFRNVRAPRIGRRASERRRYILYCMYGWGAPLPLTALLAFMQFKEDLPTSFIRPGFGELSCWFYDRKSNLLYFYVPILILVVFNLILFTITSYKIVMIKRETAVLNTTGNIRNDQYDSEKQRFFVYLKLFIFMGVNWITEIVSFIFGGSAYIWITTDLLNTMLGVFIFFTFVWKKRVKNLIIKRYNMLRYGPSESNETNRSRYRSNASSTGIGSSEYSKPTPPGEETTTFMYQ